jgi:hypothetical protein
MQRAESPNRWKWTLIFLATYSVLSAVLVAAVGRIFDVPVRSLALPFAMVAACGLPFSFLIHWVRRSYARPRTCAARLALAVFFYLLLFASVIGFSAVKVGIVSNSTIFHYVLPTLVPGAAISSATAYYLAIKRLSGSHTV